MENESAKILKFEPKRRKKAEMSEENKEKFGKSDVIEADLKKEKEIKELEKELADLQKEMENFKAKILLGEESPDEKAVLRREFILKLDYFKSKADRAYTSLHAELYNLAGDEAERESQMMGKIFKIEKAVNEMREEIWAIFKT
jgi:hypothetical protein